MRLGVETPDGSAEVKCLLLQYPTDPLLPVTAAAP